MGHVIKASCRHWTAVVVLLVTGLGGAGAAQADVVAIDDRGKRIRVEGAEAEKISRIAGEMLSAAANPDSGLMTNVIEGLRQHEVVVQVRFDEPRVLRPNPKKDPVWVQYVFIPLTGDLTGMDGNDASISAGVDGKPINTLGIEFVNQPDKYGVSYFINVAAPDSLDRLRAAVAPLGVEAVKPTPRPRPAQ